ncbi:hypothetical protein VTO42DRAFT_1497 [Malbranchea cinnamomea]
MPSLFVPSQFARAAQFTLPPRNVRGGLNAAQQRLRVAVLGGGITGLSTAFRLAEDPSIDVTLYEKSGRLGGWLRSERIEVDGGSVLFEWGPRTIRSGIGPPAMATAELLLDVCPDRILHTGRNSPAALNRYIYYPDHLIQLPALQPDRSIVSNLVSGLMHIFQQPELRNAAWSFLREPSVPPRSESVQDESVGDFLSRRFGQRAVDNLVSAGVHGIYAGDLYKLSARALLPAFWAYDANEGGILGSLARTPPDERLLPSAGVAYLGHLAAERGLDASMYLRDYGRNTSVLTLKGGMGELAETLSKKLQEMRNATIELNSTIRQIKKNQNADELSLVTSQNAEAKYNYIISTIPSAELASLSTSPSLSNLLRQHTYTVNVMVVNLYYPQPDLLPVRGFGYLIPRSIPLEQNPERALGVIFASESSVGQDTAPGTKLTVMLGGHWWDEWTDEDLPDEQCAIEMARSLLRRHLNVDAEPTLAKARLQRNAIPQYAVGHVQRMTDLRDELVDAYDSRLRVAGAWFTGVGINDCVLEARLAAAAVSMGEDRTGLEKYITPLETQERLKINLRQAGASADGQRRGS